MTRPPVVSVVTPFHNTADYLAECIESVLGQTFGDFEYLLVNNCSTDGSRELAVQYASRDARIRLIDQPALLGQVDNYNRAMAHVHPAARWVKLAQADDVLFANCLVEQLRVGEASGRIGIVGSYYVEGSRVRGGGLEYPVEHFDGRLVGRKHLRDRIFAFGTPTCLLYRAELVQARRPFYATDHPHEDTDLCYAVLREWDFGFVHQVLCFLRTRDDSITAKLEGLNDGALDFLLSLRMYGPTFLDPEEYGRIRAEYERFYFTLLGEQVLRRREPAFWRHHERVLALIGESFTGRRRLRYVARAALLQLCRPGALLRAARKALLGGGRAAPTHGGPSHA